jgi:hypothetical protein
VPLGGEVIVVVCVIVPPVLPALVPICGEVICVTCVTSVICVTCVPWVICVTCVLKLPEMVNIPPPDVPDAPGAVGKWPAMN